MAGCVKITSIIAIKGINSKKEGWSKNIKNYSPIVKGKSIIIKLTLKFEDFSDILKVLKAT